MAGIYRNPSANNINVKPNNGFVSRTVENKLQELVSVKDFGAVGNGVVDDTVALQAASDYCIANGIGTLYLPPGDYLISDTWKITRGETGRTGTVGGFASLHVRGAGTSQDVGRTRIILSSSIKDRPALCFQGSRKSALSFLSIKGSNTAPESLMAGDVFLSKNNPVDWTTTGCTADQYNPYCGIAIDPYSGTAPTTPYPNDAYGRVHTSGLYIHAVEIRNFVVCIAFKPCNDDNQAEDVSIRDCTLRGSTYGISVGGSQNKGVSVTDTKFDTLFCAITQVRFGRKIGFPIRIFSLDMVVCYRLFEINASQGACSITGVHAENFTEIGLIGVGGSTANTSIVFEGCNFARHSINSGFLLANFMHTTFIGCQFKLNTSRSSNVNFIGSGYPCVLSNCTIGYTGSDTRRSFYTPQSQGRDFIFVNGTRFNYGATKDIGTSIRVNSLPAKQELSQNTQEIYDASTGKVYSVSRMSETVSLSTTGRTLSADKLTLTLTVSNAELLSLQVGDWLSWQVSLELIIGTPIAFYRVPSFKVDAISGNTVTCSCLHNAIWLHTTPESGLFIFRENFINSTLSTATVTSGNATLTEVTTISNFAVGDWVQGTGLAANSRITAIDTGTNTITLNRNPTASGSLVEIFNSKLIALN